MFIVSIAPRCSDLTMPLRAHPLPLTDTSSLCFAIDPSVVESYTPIQAPCTSSVLKNSDCRLLKKISEARRAKNRSFDFRSGQAPHQVVKSNVGGGKCITPLLHHSIIPVSGTQPASDNLTGERELKYFFKRTCKLRDTIRTLVNLIPTSTILTKNRCSVGCLQAS